MSKSTTIRVPKELANRIDGYIDKGYYLSRSDFVTAAIRYTLIHYADLRSVFAKIHTEMINKYATEKPPQPIRTYDEYLEQGDEITIDPMRTPSEDQYTQNYLSNTQVYLAVYKGHKGDPVQIGFAYPEGLRQRVRTLNKTKYGFSRKTDFVKAAIVCLLLKTFEMDFLYDNMERYDSEVRGFSGEIMSNMLLDYLFNGSLGETIMDAVLDAFGLDEDDDEDVDPEDTDEDHQSSDKS